MVNAMATISGDVQYIQNGTVTNPCFSTKRDKGDFTSVSGSLRVFLKNHLVIWAAKSH